MTAPFRIALAALCLATPAAADSVTVFAAASLKDAMDRLAPAFHEDSGHDLTVSLAGSSALARQIQAGAPADVFISANQSWMDQLAGEGLVDAATRFDLVANALVLVGASGAAPVALDNTLAGSLGEGKLAMAMTGSVPAGIYGKAALTHLGLWEAVAPQVAESDNAGRQPDQLPPASGRGSILAAMARTSGSASAASVKSASPTVPRTAATATQ
ncbi:molybdate ABC transporter substrate-binding protein [Mangrovicoccus ximenensis]|uniref:molybdate ABC transporter substrate-binding protein n=1 Tax=Mangrovicoccus ximenensis TaxID=1911570 RepID=UPI000D344AD1|nr:molybdate ABC transporter substrate-binding protein [Mangrovicoccus ximenensis]